MATNLFNRYVWLVDTIHRAGCITFEEINKKWLKNDWSEGKALPLRTFHNHRAKTQELFNINIDCDGYNHYYIETDIDDGLRNWLLNTFTVNNLIHESYALKDRILFEEIPSGHSFLTTIIEAMRDGVALKFQYKPFWYSEVLNLEINPYCVKIFKQRWYVLGENTVLNEMRIYALDRIQSITATNIKFKMPKSFKAEAYFENAYGIAVYPEIAACKVKLKVSGNSRNYIQTLPLHHSQQDVESNEKYSVFQYHIAPARDFMRKFSNEIRLFRKYVRFIRQTTHIHIFLVGIEKVVIISQPSESFKKTAKNLYKALFYRGRYICLPKLSPSKSVLSGGFSTFFTTGLRSLQT